MDELIDRLRYEAEISDMPGQFDRLNAIADEFSADPRAAAEQAIAEALRRERMAPDDYAPMPDAPVPVENDE